MKREKKKNWLIQTSSLSKKRITSVPTRAEEGSPVIEKKNSLGKGGEQSWSFAIGSQGKDVPSIQKGGSGFQTGEDGAGRCEGKGEEKKILDCPKKERLPQKNNSSSETLY